MTEAFPLHWPAGWPRTKSPQSSRFNVSFVEARDGLLEEIKRLGGTLPVLSTNVEIRRDGLPYANQPKPADRGVAVYFLYKNKQRVFACDRWDDVKDNMRALQKTIEAIRGIERWGASEMMERAFSGFDALPPPSAAPHDYDKRHWRKVFGFGPTEPISRSYLLERYKAKAKYMHPDHPMGSERDMTELNVAKDEALEEIRLQNQSL